MLFPIGADEIKALGHSSYLRSLPELRNLQHDVILKQMCHREIPRLILRELNLPGQNSSLAQCYFYHFSSHLWSLCPCHCTEYVSYCEPGMAAGVPLGKAMTFRPEKKCALFSPLLLMKSQFTIFSSVAWTILCKIFAEFWALWSLHIFCHRTALTLAGWRCKLGFTECSSTTFSP